MRLETAGQPDAPLGWIGILRLGLVQAALGSIVVLITSTINRVMVVEYALPAMVPGALVALHYAVQMIRPRFGHAFDVGGRRTPWIIGGMAVLACGGIGCALTTLWIRPHPWLALGAAVLAYTAVGLGVGAAGTSLLVLMAKRVDAPRRAAAATILWVLMILGFAVTATTVGRFLDPYSPARLILVTAVAASIAFLIALLALGRLESTAAPPAAARRGAPAAFTFKAALAQVWAEPQARAFTMFVFLSMLAYSAQELILEPFAGLVFGYSLGASTRLSGLQHSAVFLGMVGVGLACSGARRFGSLRAWTIGGCVASGCALIGMAAADLVGPAWPLRAGVFALGAANGVFAVAAIGSMMELAHRGGAGRAGVRMGLWGAAQALAFALGGLFGTTLVDSMRYLFGSAVGAYALVFGAEAILFFAAARCAALIDSRKTQGSDANVTAVSI